MEFTNDIKLNQQPTVNEELTITYHGFLSDSPEMWIVYGFNDSWEHTSECKMEKTSDGFTAKINMLDFSTFHFCFKNANNEWDNNAYQNYITPILPCENTQTEKLEESEILDIDCLIEEILQPIAFESVKQEISETAIQITTEPIDLGAEITKILSQIEEFEIPFEDSIEYTTLEEILSGAIIETPTELLDNELTEDLLELNTQTETTNSAENTFLISPRQLNKFYLFRKKIKVSFYKIFTKLPKLIFGTENQ